MKPRITLRKALEDPQLLGAALAGPTWHTWRALLLAAMGEPLEPSELEAFQARTGRLAPPDQRVEELWAIAGRRGGKTRAMSTLAVYLGALVDHSDVLTAGERGVLPLIAPDMKQAKVALDYATGLLESTPILKQYLDDRTADTLRLTTGIDLEVRSASFRRLRGMTSVAVLADEACFWRSDESANPDTEILAAARPSLATTKGPLVVISSPYAQRGAVWDAFSRHYGPDGDPMVLVAKGTSREFNSSLAQSIVDRAMEADPASASAEYLAEFRTDIEGYARREAVEGCVDRGLRERLFDRSKSYVAFVDPSGGASDAFTMAIAHTEGKTQVLDVIRERKPPFSPEAVVDEFCTLLKAYRISTVIGDRYAGEWVAEAFRNKGIYYQPSEKSKSDIYVDLLPLLNSGAVALLDNDRLALQLTQLERRTARGGKDSIDHPRGGHDDVANSVAGSLVNAFKQGEEIQIPREGRPRSAQSGSDGWMSA